MVRCNLAACFLRLGQASDLFVHYRRLHRQRAPLQETLHAVQMAALEQSAPSAAFLEAIRRTRETTALYNRLLASVYSGPKCPEPPSGLQLADLSETHAHLLASALREVDHVLRLTVQKIGPAEAASNLRFSVNTAYFARTSRDIW